MPLTSVLDANGIYLMPIEGTPLAELVKATRSDSKLVSGGPGNYDIDASTILYMANQKDKTLKFAEHDKVMDEVTSVCVRTVQGMMQHARGVVAPAVSELVEKTCDTLRSMSVSSLLGMNVVPWNPPAPMQLAAFETMVEKYAGVAYDSPLMKMRAPTITCQEIIELMHTGAGTLDAAIDDWAAVKGETFFNAIWLNVFQITPVAAGERARTFGDIVEDAKNGLDSAVAIFLIARKMVEAGALPGTEMSAPAFENMAAELRNQAAGVISRAFEGLKTIEKAGQLVRKIEGPVTYVNERVYRAWIDAGGTNEVLFGNSLQDTPNATVTQINEKSEELKAAWQRHSTITATLESNKRFARTKEILAKHFSDQLSAIVDGEEATEGNRYTVLKLFEAELSKVRQEEMEDLWGLALRLVCRSRFFRTDAEKILSSIERVKKANPTVDVREAAAAAMIEYIGQWIAAQFKPIKL
jgi:hypothetical protein